MFKKNCLVWESEEFVPIVPVNNKPGNEELYTSSDSASLYVDKTLPSLSLFVYDFYVHVRRKPIPTSVLFQQCHFTPSQ